jgi:hypothetical protein
MQHLLVNLKAFERLSLLVGPTKRVDQRIVANDIWLNVAISGLVHAFESIDNAFRSFR